MRRLLLCALLLLAGIWCLEQRADALTPTQQSVLLGGVPAPVLDCNAQTGMSGALCSLSFSRGSNATYYNSAGVLSTASSNVPRYDYNPATGTLNGLLIEEQRTNSVEYSNAFSTSPWGTNNVTLSSGATTSPDGTVDGWNIAGTGSSSPAVYQTLVGSIAANVNAATTVFVKAAASSYVYINTWGLAGNCTAAVFDLSSGAPAASQTFVGAISGTIVLSSKISVGNGWYMLSIVSSNAVGVNQVEVGIAPAATGNSFSVGCDISNNVSSSYSVYIFGYRTQVGSFVTSYIITTSAAATRSADVATATVPSLPALSLLVSATPGVGIGTQTMVLDQLDDGTANNKITLSANTSKQLQCIVVAGGSTQATVTLGTLTAYTAFNASCAMSRGVVSGSLNGIFTSAPLATMPAVLVNQRFGANTTGNYWDGWIGRVRLYNRYLPQKTSANDNFRPLREVG